MSDSDLFLAIDQGGHASRAFVLDQQGHVLAQHAVDISTYRPAVAQVEHDASELLQSVRQVVDHVLGSLGSRVSYIKKAGLATQRSSIVCWDREIGAALSPVVSWQDRRAADWLDQFRDHSGIIHDISGLVLSPHYGASKLRWCLDHLSDVQDAQQQGRLACGPLASFLLYHLLEENPLLVDPANASRTQLWDLQTNNWSPQLLDWFGIPVECLPTVVDSRHSFGQLAFGDTKIPLVLMMGDQPAAIYARGEPDPRSIYINMGTGAFVQCVTRTLPLATGELLRGMVLKSGSDIDYAIEGTVNGAGSALTEIAKQVGLAQDDVISSAGLSHWLEVVENPPLFMNGVSGLGSPYWIDDFTSEFIGDGDAQQKLVAVAESIVFLLQKNIELLQNTASEPNRIIVSGGLSKLSRLTQSLADLSGFPVHRSPVKEATVHGIAWLLADRDSFESDPVDVQYPAENALLGDRYDQWVEAMQNKIS